MRRDVSRENVECDDVIRGHVRSNGMTPNVMVHLTTYYIERCDVNHTDVTRGDVALVH